MSFIHQHPEKRRNTNNFAQLIRRFHDLRMEHVHERKHKQYRQPTHSTNYYEKRRYTGIHYRQNHLGLGPDILTIIMGLAGAYS